MLMPPIAARAEGTRPELARADDAVVAGPAVTDPSPLTRSPESASAPGVKTPHRGVRSSGWADSRSGQLGVCGSSRSGQGRFAALCACLSAALDTAPLRPALLADCPVRNGWYGDGQVGAGSGGQARSSR